MPSELSTDGTLEVPFIGSEENQFPLGTSSFFWVSFSSGLGWD